MAAEVPAREQEEGHAAAFPRTGPARAQSRGAAGRLREVERVCYPVDVAVARVTEIIASSPDGFREAVEEGVRRAARTLRNITGLEVTGKRVKVERGHITEYRVDMKLIFLLD